MGSDVTDQANQPETVCESGTDTRTCQGCRIRAGGWQRPCSVVGHLLPPCQQRTHRLSAVHHCLPCQLVSLTAAYPKSLGIEAQHAFEALMCAEASYGVCLCTKNDQMREHPCFIQTDSFSADMEGHGAKSLAAVMTHDKGDGAHPSHALAYKVYTLHAAGEVVSCARVTHVQVQIYPPPPADMSTPLYIHYTPED